MAEGKIDAYHRGEDGQVIPEVGVLFIAVILPSKKQNGRATVIVVSTKLSTFRDYISWRGTVERRVPLCIQTSHLRADP